MKTYFKTTILLVLCLAFIGCSKDDDSDSGTNGNLNEDQGISVDDLETYQGELGILISARDIAIKGHKPTTAEISVTANSGDINETIDFDPDLNIAQLSFEVANLTEDAKNELESGVPLTITVRDENGDDIKSETFSNLSFQANPNMEEINADGLPDILDNLAFRPGVKYYIQAVQTNQESSNSSLFVAYTGNTFGVPVQLKNNYNFSDSNPKIRLHQFQFLEIPNDPGYFAIMANVNGTSPLFMKIINNYLFQDNTINASITDLNTLTNEHKFKMSRTQDNGLYTLQPKSNNEPLRKRIINNATRFNNLGDTNDDLVFVRILTVDVDWEIQGIETRHLPPILPSPTSGFAYNSKLTNCTSGLLTEQITAEHEETKTYEVSFEESFSMTSRQSSTSTTTVGVSAEASFFGASVSVSAEQSWSSTTETEISSTSTQGVSNETSETITYSSSRTIEVPPGTATNVYDAYQVYENVKVPFIQRYQIRGDFINDPSIDDVTGPLTGEEILAQFAHSNANNGTVITEVGSDYIELTVRGVSTIGDVFEAISRAESTDPNCNN